MQDPDQFWYLPGPVTLARGGPDKKAEFSFIKYKPAAVAGGAKGGGFLMFKVNLQLDPALEGKILSAVSSGVRESQSCQRSNLMKVQSSV